MNYDQALEQSKYNTAMGDVKIERNRRLDECAWTILSDSPIKNKDEWLEYRARLHRITIDCDPFSVKWPVKPKAEL